MSLFALSGILIAISSGLMAIAMFTMGRSTLQRLWGFFCISVFVWGLGGFFVGITLSPTNAELWWRITHIGIAFIPVLFLHFTYSFLGLKRNRVLFIFYLLAIIFAILAITTDLLITNMRFVFNEFYYDSPPGLLYPLFTTYFFGLAIFSHILLYLRYRKSDNTGKVRELEQTRIKYFFLATFIGFSGGSLSFLPVYEIDIYPITNFAVVVYPLIMSYAILRVQLFDIRVAAAQGTIFLLWIFIGVRTLLSQSINDLYINSILFISTVILGIFLVRSVGKEIEARERVEELAKDLEKTNVRLQELDRQKSEFVSIASHQLRSPLTAMKGYASMLLEGSYGEFPEKAKEAVSRIFESSNLMTASVEDFLNVSRIEQGRMKYEKTDFNVAKLAKMVVEELTPIAEKKKLTLSFESNEEDSYMVNADLGKIKQVFSNLIDNSIKYTPSGSIRVSVSRNDENVRFEVSDTGVGISKETLGKLFDKFVRARNAHNVNVSGSGLGLYVAKQMVKAHGGKIWAESDGEGKGSSFLVELKAL